MTSLRIHALSLLALAGPAGLSLDDLGEALSEGLGRDRGHRRAQARHLLRRLGAEGLVESGDGGESWRRCEE
jgi:hypothetical protein